MTADSLSPEAAASGTVATEIADGIATVRFHHPKGNSLPAALLARLAESIAALDDARDAAVIVLRSEGTGPFCAGASFDELTRIADPEAGREFFMGFARVILAMTRSPKLIVARVHGRIAGGGIGIVAASDYSIAVSGAAARLSELAVGIGPFVVGPAIEKKIGLAAFQQMAIDVEWRDAAWCERHGLYARVCEGADSLDDAVHTLARRLATSNPDAMTRMKRIFWEGTEHWPTLLAERAAMSGTLVLGEHTRKAIEAFGKR
jgi:methylglutaconyl-CoA hydratase